MTLTARAKPPAHHKKVSGKHHRHNKSYHKAYTPYLPLLLIAVAGVLLNAMWPNKHSVLGYATDVSIQSLLDGTNGQRAGSGLGNLSLSAALDQAAQAKANDMAARDYWSHNTPDGQTPWSFMTSAGYSYQTAGENLAYGFDSSANTITGWMNSPEHRANILNTTYQEVGFGIANSANYQGSGAETIVVAMYAKPASSAVAAATPAASPAAPLPAPAVSHAAEPAPTTTSNPADSPDSSNTATTPATSATPLKPVPEPPTQRITRVQLLTAGNASWSLLVMSLITIGGLAVFLLRHGLAWHKVLRRGELFALHHRWLDAAAVSLVVLSIVLSHSSGLIR